MMKIDSERIKRISRILTALFWAGFILAVMAMAACSIFLIVQFFLPQSVFTVEESGRLGLTLDNFLYFDLTSASSEGPVNIKPFIQTLLPFAIVVLAMLAFGILQMIGILRSVLKENPFDQKNPGRLDIIASLMIAAAFVVSFGRVLAARTLITIIGLEGVSTNFSVDVTLLLSGLLIKLLSEIFKYGSFLKNEYDATL